MKNEHDHIDGDFKLDFQHIVNRRKILSLAGIAGLLGACDLLPTGEIAEANQSAAAADGTICLKAPAETNGPFPADGTNRSAGSTINVLTKSGVIREDIRPSFDGLNDVAEGLPLNLEFKLVDMSNACKPLANHVVYIWQCDAAGTYSIYERPESNNLRGAGITDADGIVRFITVFPGCYSGRWPHIHFEIFANTDKAVSGDASLLTSQFLMEKTTCDAVYAANSAYVKSPPNFKNMTIANDVIFENSTPEQLVVQALVVSGDVAKTLKASARIVARTASA
jgi:protocatechuate 3,4-dioxygenase beta subunit